MLPRPTYANVTATLALFVALGGTSYAVTKLPRNSVGSSQVRDRSLQSKDLARGVVSKTRGPRGPQGPAGGPGPPGTQGERGPSSVRIARQAATLNLSGVRDAVTQVRRIDVLPAGGWLLRFDANARLTGANGLHTFCDLKVNGDVTATSAATVGENANVTQEVGLPIETAVQMPSAFNVTVDCRQSQGSTPAVQIIRPQIIATQVADVVVSP